jgi:hypothetical protein
MSQVNQIKAILAVGFVLSIALMWNVERDAIRGRPAHPHTVDVSSRTQPSVQSGQSGQSAQAQSSQATRI